MGDPVPDCLFCTVVAHSDDRRNLVLERGTHWFVVINRYPYTSGHVMVVCNRHAEKLSDFTREEAGELVAMLAKCERALTSAYGPDGINIGANLGRSAGAGIVGHFHMHLVPRWHGDTNFMSTVGETRVVSEDLNETFERLRRALASV